MQFGSSCANSFIPCLGLLTPLHRVRSEKVRCLCLIVLPSFWLMSLLDWFLQPLSLPGHGRSTAASQRRVCLQPTVQWIFIRLACSWIWLPGSFSVLCQEAMYSPFGTGSFAQLTFSTDTSSWHQQWMFFNPPVRGSLWRLKPTLEAQYHSSHNLLAFEIRFRVPCHGWPSGFWHCFR